MLKKCLLGLYLFISLPAMAQELSTYQDVQQSLTEGKLVSIAIKYQQCKVTNPNSIPLPNATAVIKPSIFLIRDEGMIVAQGTWFSSKIPAGPKNGSNQRFNLELNDKNQVKGTIEFYLADNGQRDDVLQDIILDCELGNGVKIYN